MRRRFVVRTLPLGLLLDTLAAVQALAERTDGSLDLRTAGVLIAGRKAGTLPLPALELIYDSFVELNRLPKGAPPVTPAARPPDSAAPSPASSSSSSAGPSATTASGSSE